MFQHCGSARGDSSEDPPLPQLRGPEVGVRRVPAVAGDGREPPPLAGPAAARHHGRLLRLPPQPGHEGSQLAAAE